MKTADKAKNFAKVTVSAGYGSGDLSIILTAGGGALLPATPFDVVWWDSTQYGDPTDDPNKEIVSVTTVATDTLTVARAKQGTTATAKNTVGSTYKMVAPFTAKFAPVIIIKDADGTAVNNSTTLVADSDLQFAIGANETWEWEVNVFWSSNTADLKWDFSGPASPTLVKLGTFDARYPGILGVFVGVATSFLSGVLGRSQQAGGSTPNLDGFSIKGICINGVTAGTIQMKIAQFTAVAENTKLLSGTMLRAQRIA